MGFTLQLKATDFNSTKKKTIHLREAPVILGMPKGKIWWSERKIPNGPRS